MATSGDEPFTGTGQTEKINTDIVTLTRFLTEEQSKHKEATGDFT
jgi:fructose-1,6-bisphosphatase I